MANEDAPTGDDWPATGSRRVVDPTRPVPATTGKKTTDPWEPPSQDWLLPGVPLPDGN